jgi:hypothetical protein
VHHARLSRLCGDTEYVYAAAHDGTTPEPGSFRTAPRGRAPFTFTSLATRAPRPGSPYAADVTTAVERVAPLFHLVNGDLCYANLATDRLRTWSDWFAMTSRSARFRPWMPATAAPST